jgi:hypothetical protein
MGIMLSVDPGNGLYRLCGPAARERLLHFGVGQRLDHVEDGAAGEVFDDDVEGRVIVQGGVKSRDEGRRVGEGSDEKVSLVSGRALLCGLYALAIQLAGLGARLSYALHGAWQ